MYKLLAEFTDKSKTSVTITRTEDVAPTENVIPETLPLNGCRTKSVRISKPPERLKLVSRWSSKFDCIITAIVIACMHSYDSYYCLTCKWLHVFVCNPDYCYLT